MMDHPLTPEEEDELLGEEDGEVLIDGEDLEDDKETEVDWKSGKLRKHSDSGSSSSKSDATTESESEADIQARLQPSQNSDASFEFLSPSPTKGNLSPIVLDGACATRVRDRLNKEFSPAGMKPDDDFSRMEKSQKPFVVPSSISVSDNVNVEEDSKDLASAYVRVGTSYTPDLQEVKTQEVEKADILSLSSDGKKGKSISDAYSSLSTSNADVLIKTNGVHLDLGLVTEKQNNSLTTSSPLSIGSNVIDDDERSLHAMREKVYEADCTSHGNDAVGVIQKETDVKFGANSGGSDAEFSALSEEKLISFTATSACLIVNDSHVVRNSDFASGDSGILSESNSAEIDPSIDSPPSVVTSLDETDILESGSDSAEKSRGSGSSVEITKREDITHPAKTVEPESENLTALQEEVDSTSVDIKNDCEINSHAQPEVTLKNKSPMDIDILESTVEESILNDVFKKCIEEPMDQSSALAQKPACEGLKVITLSGERANKEELMAAQLESSSESLPSRKSSECQRTIPRSEHTQIAITHNEDSTDSNLSMNSLETREISNICEELVSNIESQEVALRNILTSVRSDTTMEIECDAKKLDVMETHESEHKLSNLDAAKEELAKLFSFAPGSTFKRGSNSLNLDRETPGIARLFSEVSGPESKCNPSSILSIGSAREEIAQLCSAAAWEACKPGPSRSADRKMEPVAVKRVREVPRERDSSESASATSPGGTMSIGKAFPTAGGRKILFPAPSKDRNPDRGSAEPRVVSNRSSCINEMCASNSSEFVKAPAHAVVYFGCIPVTGRNRYKICKPCLEGPAKEYLKAAKSALQKRKPIYEIPISCSTGPCSTEYVENSDSESEPEIEEIELNEDIPEEVGLNETLEDLMKALNVNAQADAAVEYLDHECDELEVAQAAAEAVLDKSIAEMDILSKQFDSVVGPAHNTIVMKSVEIDPNGVVTTLKNADQEALDIAAAKTRNAEKVKLDFNGLIDEKEKETVALKEANRTEADNVDEIKVVENIVALPRPRLAPTPAVIPRMMPKVGDAVYGMRTSLLSCWARGQVLAVVRSYTGVLEYKVQFEANRRKTPNSTNDTSGMLKNITPKNLAYNLPCPFVLPVGTRVIARFNNEFKNESTEGNNYYVGIVGEPPKNANKLRYLIFFDEGYVQYVRQEDVLLVCESSKSVWLDVHAKTKDFIKNYVQKFPERPMVKLQEGTMVNVEYNGLWWNSRIVEVDCSLVKVHFPSKRRYEWIYRGSARLSPIYNKSTALQLNQVPAEVSIQPPISGPKPRQNLALCPRNQNQTLVNNHRPVLPIPKASQTARKSTAVPPSSFSQQFKHPALPAQKEVVVRRTGIRRTMTAQESRAFEGTITKIGLRQYKGPAPYVQHICNKACVKNLSHEDPDLNTYNPLSMPLYLGWDREVGKTPKRTVFYRAPCGRRIRNYSELHAFLVRTQFNLGIDYFCFDYTVDCLNEFRATYENFLLRDVSYGKESVPVQCVNSIDNHYPDYVNYTRYRQPGKGVKINLDEDFLTCCDCTDDCTDKEKCACWQLTIEGTNIGKDTRNPQAGYTNRRLMEHVVSGIYECNSKCKCRSTCFNRVVQNDMKWQLQVFKTLNKGWAIRPLHDIPQGAFICVYAGQLLTEQGANEDGKNYGDEYLAELDFIEVMESVKEGYEAEVVESEEDDEEEEGHPRKRGRRNDPDYVEMDEDSGEEDDHSLDTDFIIPGIKPSGVRGNTEHRPLMKSKLLGDSYDTSFARKSSRVVATTSTNTNAESAKDYEADAEEPEKPNTRSLFGPDEQCYIMDAKSSGNIGRYLNHCCTPNVFVQNVFVDTHDIRFPWVAFFAFKHIRAGTELTWDYNYEIGSVPGKTMECNCNSPQCRGTLL